MIGDLNEAQGPQAANAGAEAGSPGSAIAEALHIARGLRGSAGVPQAPHEAPLQGLPTKYKIPVTGGTGLAEPSPHIRQTAREYMQSAGLPYNPPTIYAKVDPERAARIAQAFHEMPHDPDHPLVKASYEALAKEAMAQYQTAKKNGFKAEFWDPDKDDDPYKASPRMAIDDVQKNNHMWVYPTESGFGTSDADISGNPLLRDSGERWNGKRVTYNDIFRAIHDYYGHAKEGVGFRADGEENAWRAHASMFSPLARMAMTTETRGQNSWLNYGPHGDKNRTARTEDTVFADQKSGILPHWAHHEGAEDFMTPDDIHAMQQTRGNYRHGGVVGKALKLVKGR